MASLRSLSTARRSRSLTRSVIPVLAHRQSCAALRWGASMASALVDALAGSRTVSAAVAGGYQERPRGNNAQVWRAICSSSREARTSTEQRDAGSLMGLFADRFRAL